jgi:hypothetical protein
MRQSGRWPRNPSARAQLDGSGCRSPCDRRLGRLHLPLLPPHRADRDVPRARAGRARDPRRALPPAGAAAASDRRDRGGRARRENPDRGARPVPEAGRLGAPARGDRAPPSCADATRPRRSTSCSARRRPTRPATSGRWRRTASGDGTTPRRGWTGSCAGVPATGRRASSATGCGGCERRRRETSGTASTTRRESEQPGRFTSGPSPTVETRAAQGATRERAGGPRLRSDAAMRCGSAVRRRELVDRPG